MKLLKYFFPFICVLPILVCYIFLHFERGDTQKKTIVLATSTSRTRDILLCCHLVCFKFNFLDGF